MPPGPVMKCSEVAKITAISTSMPRIEQIRRALRQQRQAEQQRQHHDAERLQQRRRRADRIFRLGDRAHRGLRAAEQAVGPHDQHHRHHQEFGDQRELGEIDAEKPKSTTPMPMQIALTSAMMHGGEIGAGDRAHAADHDDDEGVADGGQVHREIGRLARHLQRAAEAGERGAEREHGGEQHRLVDAERADHFAVLRRRAHQGAEARARQARNAATSSTSGPRTMRNRS